MIWRSILLCLVITPSCLAGATAYSFYDEFASYNNAYYTGSETSVKFVIIDFITNAELNWRLARSDRRISYGNVLAMAWLRLACIYQREQDQIRFDNAMMHSIKYFDQINSIASDPKYLKDKKTTLLEFLYKSEEPNPPKWRAQAKGVMS